jgi:hypothetical protein
MLHVAILVRYTYSEDEHEELLFSDSVSPVLELLEAMDTCDRTDVPLLY